jgi:acyl-coenzyme A thioesterase PaaI-like protein
MTKFFSIQTVTTLQMWLFGFFKIPLIFFCRPRVVNISDKSLEVKIKLNRKTRNHLKSMYFGVLSVGADLTGGFLAMKHIRNHDANIALIFKDFHADFLKRAEGDVHFICDEGDKLKELVDIAYKTGERQSLPIHIKAFVPSISMDSVATFILTLSLKKK